MTYQHTGRYKKMAQSIISRRIIDDVNLTSKALCALQAIKRSNPEGYAEGVSSKYAADEPN
jgi:hypothetical protein